MRLRIALAEAEPPQVRKAFKKKLGEQVKQSKVMFSKFALHAEHVLKAGGSVTFEWPRDCEGWQRPDVAVSFHGCAVGLTDENGSPIKKPWRIKTTSKALAMHSLIASVHTQSPKNILQRQGAEPPALHSTLSKCVV